MTHRDSATIRYGFGSWERSRIEVDANKFAGVFKVLPDRADLPADIYDVLIVELYSK